MDCQLDKALHQRARGSRGAAGVFYAFTPGCTSQYNMCSPRLIPPSCQPPCPLLYGGHIDKSIPQWAARTNQVTTTFSKGPDWPIQPPLLSLRPVARGHESGFIPNSAVIRLTYRIRDNPDSCLCATGRWRYLCTCLFIRTIL